jgi:hypothetical protein
MPRDGYCAVTVLEQRELPGSQNKEPRHLPGFLSYQAERYGIVMVTRFEQRVVAVSQIQ